MFDGIVILVLVNTCVRIVVLVLVTERVFDRIVILVLVTERVRLFSGCAMVT